MHQGSPQNTQTRYWPQMRRILGLALPMAWSRFIQMLGWFVGMLMVARLGEVYLEASALISSTMVTILVIFMTLLFAVSVVAGRLYGESRPKAIGALLQQSLMFAVVAGVCMTVIYLYVSDFLAWTGQEPKLVAIAAKYFHAFAWASIPFTVLVALQQCCYGILKQRLVIINNILSLIVFIPASYVFIYGGIGIKPMGVAGLAWAILLQNVLNIISLLVSMYYLRDFDQYEVFKRHSHKGLKYIKQLYVVGWPMSVQFGGELVAFFVLTIFTGWISTSALAASQITQQVIFLLLVPLFAIAEAAGILVSQAIGAKDFARIKRDGNACILLGVILIILFSATFYIIPDQWAALYIDVHKASNHATLLLTRYLFYISSLMLLMDTFRNLYAGALRGFYDTQYPMWLSLIVLWLVAVPLAYVFAFDFHWGVVGIRVGVVVGFAIGAVMLWRRWVKRTRELKYSELSS